jgi:signal recognition particle subunit SRP54
MFDFLSQKFSSLFSRFDNGEKLTESNVAQTLDQLKQALLEADVPYRVVDSFTQSVKEDVLGTKAIASLKPAEHLMKIVQDKIIMFLGGEGVVAPFPSSMVLMVMGLQGSGKTTTLGKLAYKIKKDALKEGKTKKILVASVDFYRPAAIDQLELLADRVGVDFYRTQSKQPLLAVKEIISRHQQHCYDVLLLDTAGRLHVDNNLLQELQEIDALLQPNYKILVLDAMTGQESLSVAKVFEDTVGFKGAILTKMDSDTRGGSAFAFRYVLKKPILFVGEGENVADLSFFFPDRAAERILGMGDVRSLIEQAEEKIALNEREKAEEAFKSGSFSLQDFADQMAMMSKLGSLSQLLKYMPGGGMNVSPDVIQKGEVELSKFRAIISSMTLKERLNPSILDNSRMKRVAQGAGVVQQDVAMLLKRFEEAKQYVKLLNRFGSH